MSIDRERRRERADEIERWALDSSHPYDHPVIHRMRQDFDALLADAYEAAAPGERDPRDERLARAYTLLISAEPALVRAHRQSPNDVAARLNATLHDAVLDWLIDYGDAHGRSDPRSLTRLATLGTPGAPES